MSLKFLISTILSPFFWIRYQSIKESFPHVMSSRETMKLLIDSRKSFARFGDGEFSIIVGGKIGFQSQNPKLAERIGTILKHPVDSCIIGIPDVFNDLKQFRLEGRNFWLYKITRFWPLWQNLFSKNYIYSDSLVSRFYLDMKDKTESRNILDSWQMLWKDRDITIIEGDKTMMGVGNSLFQGARSIKRIICPAKDAFDRYDEIYEYTLSLSKDDLILIALGPTASVLAYDLSTKGYQAIDSGHLDLEYNWLLKGSLHKESIQGRLINELHDYNYEELKSQEYETQIIHRVS